MPLREKIARAMHKRAMADSTRAEQAFDDNPGKHLWLASADAALEVRLEVTDEMVVRFYQEALRMPSPLRADTVGQHVLNIRRCLAAALEASAAVTGDAIAAGDMEDGASPRGATHGQ